MIVSVCVQMQRCTESVCTPLNRAGLRSKMSQNRLIQSRITRGLGAGGNNNSKLSKISTTGREEDYRKNMCHAAMETGPMNSAQKDF